MKTTVLTILIGLCAAFLAREAVAAERGLLPLQPQQLLVALPKTREGWVLKKSIASNDADEWLVSKAERLFELPPRNRGEKPALARFSIIDTAKQGALLERFENFAPGQVTEGVEALTVDGMPAFRSVYGSRVKLQVLVYERFVLGVLLKNQEQDALKDWLRLVEIGQLRGPASNSKFVRRPEEVTIVKIDELDPEKAYSYSLSMSR